MIDNNGEFFFDIVLDNVGFFMIMVLGLGIDGSEEVVVMLEVEFIVIIFYYI